ncbi:hypothetical protein ACSFA3_10480 [Variovorax sp. RHLX14]|uniref:hypothetical protein n=1 Tax=Variovorax sp. RHLX14 TaxID=1259731 RepID=UPI003F4792F4
MKSSIDLKVNVSVLAAALLLAACGGGGGSPSVPTSVATGTSTGTGTGTGTGTSTTTPVAADLIVSLDKSAISNSGTDQSSLTVTAVDASRNIVAGVPVSVTLDGNAVFTPGTGAVTGADGVFTGKIGIGSDKSNRLVNYKVNSGTLAKAGAVSVTGIVLESSTTPSKPQPGETVVMRVVVKDATGNVVAGTRVNVSGVPGAAIAAQTTGSGGSVTFSFAAPAVGTYPLAIESSGATTSLALQVQSSVAGTVLPAVGPVSGASAIATPVVVASNTSGSTANQSEIRALFYAANNVPIPDMRVRFSIRSNSLPGESLTTGSNVVYSDVTGAARTSYIAALTGSPTNGVIVRACYDLVDFASSACPNFVETALTVTSSPVSLTIGSDNVITKSASGIQYIKQFQIQAVDSAGNAKADVSLSAVVDIDGYWKGSTPPAPATLLTQDIYSGTPATLTHKWCFNEDINRNSVLDATEDTNHDGFLTPRKSDVALLFVNSVTKTDASGLALIQLSYSQNLATWLRVKIKVTAGVSGSEGETTYVYILRAAQEDAANGSFLTPPYGSSRGQTFPLVDQDGEGCRTPN